VPPSSRLSFESVPMHARGRCRMRDHTISGLEQLPRNCSAGTYPLQLESRYTNQTAATTEKGKLDNC
jgi:hypothetical protein